MTKKEVQRRVLQNGKPLALNKFSWNSKTRTFSTTENSLVLDFTSINDVIFKTSYNCTFKTGNRCTFYTDNRCSFNTGCMCTFNTGCMCTFDPGYGCTFTTDYGCIFNTASGCTWIIDGKKYNFAPLYLTGSMWPLNVYKPNVLKIGCEEHDFEYWLTNYKKIAEKNDASDVVDEYKSMIDVAYEWAKSKGWDK